ncbi:ShlB/FhaC/HecB family hemolysin secretion/activation protein, partial [Escherichia coli]|uniref:ShlB/FhaC/HecB family hemolysin secretion/activation protein n=1 Tax=Escherichia coli TaxID=562 RepID=UPI0020776B4F
LVDYTYSWSDYLSTIDNRGWRWRSTGDLQTHRLGLSHVLFRNLTASATGQLTSTGDIMSQGDTTLNAATTNNRGSLLSAGTLSLDGNSLDNRGTVQGNHVTIR